MSKPILLYDFEAPEYARKGFGARIYDLAQALHYCNKSNATLKLIKNQSIPYFADKWNDVLDWPPSNTVTLEEAQALPKWPNCPYGGFKSGDMEQYAKLLKVILRLPAPLKRQVQDLVKETGFQDTDIVVHIRWTDKTKQVASLATVSESAEQDLNWYWDEIRTYFESNSKRRIFLCTDAVEVLQRLPKEFEFTWDQKETRRSEGYCPAAYSNQISKEEQKQELLQCLKNLEIMRRSEFLVGARCSYFFRVAELLHYPKPSVNVKDSDAFKKAEYADPLEEPVRPCRLKAYPRFINPYLGKKEIERCKRELKEKGMTSVHHVLREDLAEQILKELQAMPDSMFVQSIKHQKDANAHQIALSNKGEIARQLRQAKLDQEQGLFTYSFKRTFHAHPLDCMCPGCRIPDSVGSYEFLKFVNDLTGIKLTGINEWFVSKYAKDDYLNNHFDKGKTSGTVGVACVFSFNKNWKIENGGHLLFLDTKKNEIKQAIVPAFNSLNIFILDDTKPNVDHLVTQVTGTQCRLSVTGWMNSTPV